ncbi:MAG: efflux RND transporter periplasmic adaptor subunit [Deltaproteobacteria bacterium]|jgi:HlyD family secretion protein|nr:efflux RND transporter periplasmic adaptor subunit [Deltaproteobacteria bacterium]
MAVSERTSELSAPRKIPAVAKVVLIGSVVVLALALGLRAKSKLAAREAQNEQLKATAAAAANEPKRTAATVVGKPERWRPTVRLEGTLQPAMDVDLGFKAPGQLAQIKVKLGSVVKAGQVLAVLDDEAARAQRGAAEAQLRAAEAQLALAEDGERRVSKMNAAGAVAEQQAVQSVNQVKLARAQVDGAKAQLSLAETAVGNHSLKAPFGGVVTQAPTALGMIVGAGTPLFHLTDVAKLRLVGTINQEDASLADVGAAIEVQVDGRAASGRVTAVLPTLEPATRRVRVEAEIDNATTPQLRAGSFVRAQIEGTAEVDVLRFPSTILRPGMDDEVFVLEGGKLHSRTIAYSNQGDGTLLVRRGLSAEDRVLAQPTTNDRDGKVVEQ